MAVAKVDAIDFIIGLGGGSSMATATPTPPSGFVAALVTELRVRRDLGTALITEAPTKLCAAMLAKIARRRLSAFRAKRLSAAAFAHLRIALKRSGQVATVCAR